VNCFLFSVTGAIIVFAIINRKMLFSNKWRG
jgi:hypothetical protein